MSDTINEMKREMYLDSDHVDHINNPKHYTFGGIETIEYMKAKSSKEEFLGYLRLNALKYLSRAFHKDDALQDFKKAGWYIERLVKEMDT